MGHVIAISNVKGGVAKTSTASALGRCLSKLGHRVLLVDLDAQADLTISVGITQGGIAYGSKDLFAPGLLEKLGINNFIVPTVYENLDILPSKGEMDWYDRGLADSVNLGNLLRDLFESKLRARYDFIVMDCAPAINIHTLNALAAADLVIVPTQAEYFSANSLVKMMRIIRRVRQDSSPNLSYRILVNMFAQRTRVQRNIMEEFRKGFGENLFATYIEIDTKIRESQSARVPIVDYNPRSRAAIQYQNLAIDVLNFFTKKASAPTPKTVPPAENASIETEEASRAFCPFLGFKDDIKTVMNYASSLNHCHRARHQAIPKMEYQNSHCLTKAYLSCQLLQTRQKIELSAQLQEEQPKLWGRFKI
jgi:chromosome partitioning protein